MGYNPLLLLFSLIFKSSQIWPVDLLSPGSCVLLTRLCHLLAFPYSLVCTYTCVNTYKYVLSSSCPFPAPALETAISSRPLVPFSGEGIRNQDIGPGLSRLLAAGFSRQLGHGDMHIYDIQQQLYIYI